MSDKKETLIEYLDEAWGINGYNPEDWDDDYNRYNEVIAICNSVWGYLSDKLDQKDAILSEQENRIKELEDHKVYYDRLFAKSVVIPTEEYSNLITRIKELEEENKELLQCNKEFQNRAVYWMNEHDKIKNKYEPEILIIGEE